MSVWVQLVEWKGQLFAIGGHDSPILSGLKDTVERFDDNTQQWEVIEEKLPQPMTQFAAIVF